MGAMLVAVPLIFAVAAAAQQPTPTAEQVIEKSIAATGGREALGKLSSFYAKGSMEFPASEMHGVIERYAKKPNKRLTVTELEGVGKSRQGFDGQVAWSEDPSGKVTEVTGAALDALKRGAVFDSVLDWRSRYPKAEFIGKKPIEGGEAYVLKLTDASGKVATHWYDAGTYLLVRETTTFGTGEDAMEVTVEFSDYRDVDGIKTAFRIRQMMPLGEIVFTITELKNNVPIEDAIFAPPAAK